MWGVLEVRCFPHPSDSYPIPTTMKLVKVFATEQEAIADGWATQDRVYNPPEEFAGQQVYQMIWNTDEPVNLDRHIQNTRKVSNVGEWLPESKQIWSDTSDIQLQPIPPERLKERARRREMAQKVAGPKGKAKQKGQPRVTFPNKYPHSTIGGPDVQDRIVLDERQDEPANPPKNPFIHYKTQPYGAAKRKTGVGQNMF